MDSDHLRACLQKHFNRLEKLRRTLHKQGFHRLPHRSKTYLVNKIHRILQRIRSLQAQLQMAAVAGVAAFAFGLSSAQAQTTTLGPFQEQRRAFNPLFEPLPFATPAISTFDYQNDGDYDLVVGEQFGYLNVVINEGSATDPRFSLLPSLQNPFRDIVIGDSYGKPSFADFDEDGDDDLFLGTGSGGQVRYFVNDNGTFVEQLLPWGDPTEITGNPMIKDGFFPAGFSSVTAADIDGDNDIDIVLSKSSDGTTPINFDKPLWFENDGTGNLFFDVAAPDGKFLPGEPIGNFATFGDWDKDGDQDLVTSLYTYSDPTSASYVRFKYYKNVAGTFVLQTGMWIPSSKSGNPFNQFNDDFQLWVSIHLVDLTGDGNLDLISGLAPTTFGLRTGRSAIDLYENQGDGSVEQRLFLENRLHGFDMGSNATPAFGDINGDGDLDVLVGGNNIDGDGWIDFIESQNGKYLWHQEAGENSENPFSPVNIGGDTPGPSFTPTLFDFDGDGDLDVMGSANNTAEPLMYYKNHLGNFSYVPEATGPFRDIDNLHSLSNAHATFGDLDQDGDMDMVLGGRFGSTGAFLLYHFKNFQVEENLTDPRFEDVASGLFTSFNEEWPIQPRLIDFDGDDDLDLLIGEDGSNDDGLQGNEVIYYENTGTVGSPTYTLRTSNFFNRLGTNANPINPGISSIDYDQDGDIDLFIGNAYGQIVYFRNDNPAPSVTARTSVNFDFNTPVVLDGSLQLSDSDNDPIARVTVTISGYEAGKDLLTVGTLPAGITSSFADGLLTLRGPASVADFQTALRGIQYQYLAAGSGRTRGITAARTVTRSLTLRALDIDRTISTTNIANVSLVHANQAPQLGPAGNSITYTGTAINVHPSVAITDLDDTVLSSAEVVFTGSSFVATEDRLVAGSLPTGITATFNTGTGTLSISGNGSLADYQSVLRNVRYQNQSSAPTTANRTLQLIVSDSQLNSNSLDVVVSIAIPNGAPLLASPTTQRTFTGSPIAIDDAVTVVDPDNVIASASVQITVGFAPGEDVLTFINQNGISGSYNTTTGLLSLTGSATPTLYEAALRSVNYVNTAPDRTNANRTVVVLVHDGLLASNAVSFTLAIPNAAPNAALSRTSAGFMGGNVTLDDALTVTDDDDLNLASATLQFQTGFVSGEDVLQVTNGSGLTFDFDSTTGMLTFSGSATKSSYQSALRSVVYQNAAGNRSPGTRVLALTVHDGQSASSPETFSIMVQNEPPVLTAGNTENFYLSGSLPVNNALTIADADNTHLQQATVRITNGLVPTEDRLLFIEQNGITGTYDATNGTLQLTGNATVANYFTALRSIRYENTAAAPDTRNRLISFSVNDGNNSSNTITTTMGINAAPVVAADPQSISAGGTVEWSIESILSDPDNNLDFSTLSVTSAQGAAVTIANGRIGIDYGNVSDFQGRDQLTIRICDIGGRCSIQIIDIEVVADLIVYNGISPNGDGANDYFKIRFLPANSRVSIFNRWGDLVFSRDDYDNNERPKRFEGRNNDGNELGSGTYFYKIETPQGRSVTGYLTLKR